MTGRNYKLFDYRGSPTAERVAVCMGSASKTLEETVDYMNQHGENVGLLNVHLFRPWSTWHFLNELPKTATKIAVLDKTREEGNVTNTPPSPLRSDAPVLVVIPTKARDYVFTAVGLSVCDYDN